MLPLKFFNSRADKTPDSQRRDCEFDSHNILIYIFSKKALRYAILHLYLQQPGIMKMFLLCNIPGKVLLFFLNKHDIM